MLNAVERKLTMVLLRVTTLCGLFFMGFVSDALATPVKYTFSGDVTFANGEFENQGSIVTGTIQFDDGLTDGNPNADVAQYNKTLSVNAPLAGVFSYTLTVGAVTKTGTGADPTPVAFLQLFDDETQVADQVTFSVGTSPFDILILRALQGSENDLVLPPAVGGFNPISDAINVLSNLDPTQFGNANSIWGAGSNQVQFIWKEISLVPIPAALPLFTSALFGLGLLMRQRRRLAT